MTKMVFTWSAQIVTGALLIVAALGWWSNYVFLDNLIAAGFLYLGLLAFLMGYRRIGTGALLLTLLYLIPWHLPRNIWVTIDLLSLGAMIYTGHWATNPFRKGNRFERYVTSLFPEPEYVIESMTRDVSKFLDRRIESDMNPDFVFRNQKTGKKFAVECKWRGQWFKGKPENGIWWNLRQGNRYIQFERESGIPTYIALGIGGSPEKPKEVYFLEAGKLQYPFLKQSFVRSGTKILHAI